MPGVRGNNGSQKKKERSSVKRASSKSSGATNGDSGHGGTTEEKLETARAYVTMDFDYIGVDKMQEAAKNPNPISRRR